MDNKSASCPPPPRISLIVDGKGLHLVSTSSFNHHCYNPSMLCGQTHYKMTPTCFRSELTDGLLKTGVVLSYQCFLPIGSQLGQLGEALPTPRPPPALEIHFFSSSTFSFSCNPPVRYPQYHPLGLAPQSSEIMWFPSLTVWEWIGCGKKERQELGLPSPWGVMVCMLLNTFHTFSPSFPSPPASYSLHRLPLNDSTHLSPSLKLSLLTFLPHSLLSSLLFLRFFFSLEKSPPFLIFNQLKSSALPVPSIHSLMSSCF